LSMPAQIPLPLTTPAKLRREDFIVGPGNAAAVGFIDSWPTWPAPAAALFGPAGTGKSHLSGAWAERAGAEILDAASLSETVLAKHLPLVIENIDQAPLMSEAETALFALLERGQSLLLTGRERPSAWPVRLPDLTSRFGALIGFPLWAPDDALLKGLARKLFADRQLSVPEAVIEQMVRLLERSPAAIREFVARADAAALAEKRPINLGLIRGLLANTG
jgi:chromosomal replication initiation ATPase DnaA